MLPADRDLALEAAQFGLPGGEVFGPGVARDLRQQRARAGCPQLELREIAPPGLALARVVGERPVEYIVGPPQRLVGAMRFRLRARQLAVEMLDRGFDDRDVPAQPISRVAPLVDLADGVGRGLGDARPGTIGRLGVRMSLAHPREFRLGVLAPVVEMDQRREGVLLRQHLAVGNALRRRRRLFVAILAKVGEQFVDARLLRSGASGFGVAGASARWGALLRTEHWQARDLGRGGKRRSKQQR